MEDILVPCVLTNNLRVNKVEYKVNALVQTESDNFIHHTIFTRAHFAMRAPVEKAANKVMKMDVF